MIPFLTECVLTAAKAGVGILTLGVLFDAVLFAVWLAMKAVHCLLFNKPFRRTGKDTEEP